MFALKTKIQNNRPKQSDSKESGFTLIELLIVIAIIGLLASIVLAAVQNTRKQAFNKKMIRDKNTLIQALTLYIGDVGGSQFAATFPNTNCIGDLSDTCFGGVMPANGALNIALTPYISSFPKPRGKSSWSRGGIPLAVDTGAARTIGILWPIEGTDSSSCPVGTNNSYAFGIGDSYIYCVENFTKY